LRVYHKKTKEKIIMDVSYDIFQYPKMEIEKISKEFIPKKSKKIKNKQRRKQQCKKKKS